ncbi:hypothetical protein ADUPG1_000588 [Aduncisulcus paluster]|uniref:Condensin complex subunit 2 n=1 Tax=Aduncisulcus paluster TaxID=2918883 RepID=A0ABQ5KAG6_9EUKA|nr:hypothetical protein ADUPG1_000588 [Aduncisulcus paluster]
MLGFKDKLKDFIKASSKTKISDEELWGADFLDDYVKELDDTQSHSLDFTLAAETVNQGVKMFNKRVDSTFKSVTQAYLSLSKSDDTEKYDSDDQEKKKHKRERKVPIKRKKGKILLTSKDKSKITRQNKKEIRSFSSHALSSLFLLPPDRCLYLRHDSDIRYMEGIDRLRAIEGQQKGSTEGSDLMRNSSSFYAGSFDFCGGLSGICGCGGQFERFVECSRIQSVQRIQQKTRRTSASLEEKKIAGTSSTDHQVREKEEDDEETPIIIDGKDEEEEATNIATDIANLTIVEDEEEENSDKKESDQSGFAIDQPKIEPSQPPAPQLVPRGMIGINVISQLLENLAVEKRRQEHQITRSRGLVDSIGPNTIQGKEDFDAFDASGFAQDDGDFGGDDGFGMEFAGMDDMTHPSAGLDEVSEMLHQENEDMLADAALLLHEGEERERERAAHLYPQGSDKQSGGNNAGKGEFFSVYDECLINFEQHGKIIRKRNMQKGTKKAKKEASQRPKKQKIESIDLSRTFSDEERLAILNCQTSVKKRQRERERAAHLYPQGSDKQSGGNNAGKGEFFSVYYECLINFEQHGKIIRKRNMQKGTKKAKKEASQRPKKQKIESIDLSRTFSDEERLAILNCQTSVKKRRSTASSSSSPYDASVHTFNTIPDPLCMFQECPYSMPEIMFIHNRKHLLRETRILRHNGHVDQVRVISSSSRTGTRARRARQSTRSDIFDDDDQGTFQHQDDYDGFGDDGFGGDDGFVSDYQGVENAGKDLVMGDISQRGSMMNAHHDLEEFKQILGTAMEEGGGAGWDDMDVNVQGHDKGIFGNLTSTPGQFGDGSSRKGSDSWVDRLKIVQQGGNIGGRVNVVSLKKGIIRNLEDHPIIMSEKSGGVDSKEEKEKKQEDGKEERDSKSGDVENSKEMEDNKHSFASMLATMPKTFAETEKMTIPMCFVALLHLCNEEVLALNPDHDDFTIEKDNGEDL